MIMSILAFDLSDLSESAPSYTGTEDFGEIMVLSSETMDNLQAADSPTCREFRDVCSPRRAIRHLPEKARILSNI
jgi:hypothetical protein